MTDQLNGLRFDIYERVHLPDDVAAIEELEEIELVPHMQALPQDDQVLLRGHLLLSGIYRSQDSAGVSQLEHWIPVEISLPLNRIQSVEELAVEIDNFDVDLLTTRSLNVTGVLALRGLQVQSAQSPIWRDDSFTVVHQAEQETEEQQASYRQDRDLYEVVSSEDLSADDYASESETELIEQDREDAWGLQSETDAIALETSAQKENNWLSMFQNLEESRKEESIDFNPEFQSENKPIEESSWGDVTKERLVEDVLLQESSFGFASEPIIEPEDKPDVKVALGGKALDAVQAQSQSQSQSQFGVGLLSQLGDKGAKREAELRILEAAQAEEKAQQASQSAQSSGDELEWTRLFLNNGAQAQSFRKVKMCIVQREETLDLIANRYNVQPRELQLYNRLNEPYLSEGQVLYIP
ncbi:LysM peptidoglycan-binding domain-containing protein [Cohnella herbarum]|uniref:LysM peptidoglycan-binding domain-containing protein n=1 Tax=Cohnella herbarum TaxID=2728023 RepID=A0A7Z2ZJE0_9BACL|nr:LysM peptidoglycan-binding domain-containing protein [Cohnella herbarum]QJD81788.1 LysM peptidoglycan-binding domain-containing protein [Cohnella herbarum]